MRTLNVLLFASITAFMAMPALATECANSGTVPAVVPDDTGDGDATACGRGAVTDGQASTALGYIASSVGSFSTALGFSAESAGASSAALGTESISGGILSIALGPFASSAGDNSSALGYLASSSGISSTTLGHQASSVGNNSAALGMSASSVGEYSLAAGYQASSAGTVSLALGSGANSSGASSAALGNGAASDGQATVALGFFASSDGDFSSALGYGSESAGVSSIALGVETSSTGFQSTALGYRAFADQLDTVILGSIAGVNGASAYAKVGIGTSVPSEAVDVQRSAAAARFQLTSFTDTASEAPQFIQRRARGTTLAPTAVQNNDNLGLFSFRGYNGTSMGGSRAAITAQAAGTFTDTSTPTRLIFSTTPVGQTAPQSVLVITPDGKVQVKGVNLNVPDYVFEDDYALMPLDELKTFIDENGHLPGMPSADEVNSGVHDLAGSDMAQLQKIEELTLYTLQLQDQVRQQQVRIADLESLQDRVAQLEMSAQHRALAGHD